MEPSTNVDGEASLDQAVLTHERASMEPSTNVDGEAWVAAVPAAATGCFNGGVDERRRRGIPPRALRRTTGSFNGAVDERRRRECARADGRGADAASMEPSTNVDGERNNRSSAAHGRLLQWSRRRTSTESRSSARATACAAV